MWDAKLQEALKREQIATCYGLVYDACTVLLEASEALDGALGNRCAEMAEKIVTVPRYMADLLNETVVSWNRNAGSSAASERLKS